MKILKTLRSKHSIQALAVEKKCLLIEEAVSKILPEPEEAAKWARPINNVTLPHVLFTRYKIYVGKLGVPSKTDSLSENRQVYAAIDIGLLFYAQRRRIDMELTTPGCESPISIYQRILIDILSTKKYKKIFKRLNITKHLKLSGVFHIPIEYINHVMDIHKLAMAQYFIKCGPTKIRKSIQECKHDLMVKNKKLKLLQTQLEKALTKQGKKA